LFPLEDLPSSGGKFVSLENGILIYSEKNGPRLKYICDLIFKDVYGLSYAITSNHEEFINYTGARISYSNREADKGIRITPFTLLFEYGVKDHHVEVNGNNLYKHIFFKTPNGALPFDIFSASFWLLTRYEEYLPFIPDQFNRFDISNSLAYQYHFIEIPLVNLWLEKFKKLLSDSYPGLQFGRRKFNFISTIDIDNAYKYRYKGLMRTLGGYLKSILRNNRKELNERMLVLSKRKNDPFDSYDFLLSVQEEFKLKTLFFFLLGDYGVNDKNHPSNNKDFQALIKHLADYSEIGIHPSYGSNTNLYQLKIEVNRLANITHRDIINSRQHFSVLSFPYTYQSLLQSGIVNDYSMGYANYNGFRASFCWPYNWYDLDSEQETSLIIHPFCIIETSIRFHNLATPGNAVSVAKPMIDEVKKYGGELVSIFHNDTLGEEPEWEGWRNVYRDFIKEVTGK